MDHGPWTMDYGLWTIADPQILASNTIPDILRICFFFSADENEPRNRHSHIIRIWRLSRRASSKVERNSSSPQPNGRKNSVPFAGANRNGALPASTLFPHDGYKGMGRNGFDKSRSRHAKLRISRTSLTSSPASSGFRKVSRAPLATR